MGTIMNLVIRHADPLKDSRHISNLIKTCIEEKRTLLPPYSTDEERQYLENLQPRESVFVAYVADAFAGFAGVAPRWPYSDKLMHCGEAGTWVVPKFRGRGIGRSLWKDGILPWCMENGLIHLGAMVLAHNTGSVAFYEKMGFKIIGTHQRVVKWGDKYLDTVEIERVLC